MDILKLFVDFNNADLHGRVRLNTNQTFADIDILKLELKEGMQVFLDDEDRLATIGHLTYSDEENTWVAEINWDTLYLNRKTSFH